MKSPITIILVLVILSLMFVSGCQRQKPMDKSNMPNADSPYSKVHVTKAGEVILDGKTVTLDELDRGLAALAQKHGVVLYSREAPHENEPPPVFKNVLDIVIKNRIPVRLCVNSDCSDALTSDGKLRIDN